MSATVDLRKDLNDQLKSPSDFDAYVHAYYPTTYQAFSLGMDRTAKTTELLNREDAEHIRLTLHNFVARLYPPQPEIAAGAAHRPNDAAVAIESTPTYSYDARHYVERPLEQELLLQGLRERRLAVVHGPKRYGKTWTLCHCIEKLRRSEDYAVAYVQVERLDGSPWLTQLFVDLLDVLGLIPRLYQRSEIEPYFDRLRSQLGMAIAFKTAVKEKILSKIGSKLLIAVDNADFLVGRDEQNAFFGMLRSWSENRSDKLLLRVHMALCISLPPTMLITDPRRSHLHGLVFLPDLSLDQVRGVVQRHGLTTNEETLQTMHGLVGGHPDLINLLCTAAQKGQRSLPDVVNQAVLQPWGGVLKGHLKALEASLAAHPHRDPHGNLLESLRRLAKDPTALSGSAFLQTRQFLDQFALIDDGDRPGEWKLRHRLYQKLLVE